MAKYLEIFESRDDVAREFEAGRWDGSRYGGGVFVPDEDFPTDDEIIVAVYDYEDYSGDAFVLFKRDGRLFEVHGGHCSCNGLEGQWEPEETTLDALLMRRKEKYHYGVQFHPEVQAVISALEAE